MKTTGKLTDNRSIESKVALRRWLLDRMGITEAYVLDTCSGLGKIWTAMEDHVTIRQWTRCDIKPRRPGTLKMDAEEAVQGFQLAAYNVIDIDPYGEPWEAYHLALARLSRPTAFFLTHGRVALSSTTNASLRRLGVPEGWKVPQSPALSAFVAESLLAQTWERADILHAGKIEYHSNGPSGVTYYAIGVRPKTS